MRLNEIDIDELEKEEIKAKETVVEESEIRKNHYLDIVETKYTSPKRYTGVLVTGVVMILMSVTVTVATLLLAYSGKLPSKINKEPVEPTFTQAEVDEMIEASVNKAKEETRDSVDSEYKSKIHEAAEVAGGTANFLRSLFPDEMVFVDGYKYKFIPINRSLKLSTIEAAKFITEDNGFMFYTDNDGNRISYIGIDVSSFQKDVDWSAVKASGIDFAIIRCGLRGYGSEGNLVADSYFEQNIQGAMAAGVNVGVYFYTQALNTDEAREEAEFALSLIDPYGIKGPVVLDVESASSEERIKNITASERTDCIIAFCERIKEAGYNPMVYADVKYFTMRMEIERLEEYKKWYANYNGLSIGEEMSIWAYNNPFMFPYEFSIWQYSNTGKIDGVNGPVDFDVLFEKWW